MVGKPCIFATSVFTSLYRSSIEIDTRNADEPVANIEVLIDGEVAHR